MNTATHPVSPEEVMAYLDGELTAFEAQEVSRHIGQCLDCAALAGQFRELSQSLSAWTVEDAQVGLEQVVQHSRAKSDWGVEHRQATSAVRSGRWTPLHWVFGGIGAVALLLVVLTVIAPFRPPQQPVMMTRRMPEMDQPAPRMPLQPPALAIRQSPAPQGDALQSAARRPAAQAEIGVPVYPMDAPPPPVASKGVIGGNNHPAASALPSAPSNLPTQAPMIARSVSLTIVVKDFGSAREAVDAIVKRHQGYAAQLSLNTPDNFARSYQASLRVPAPELEAAIGELRSLGRVENENQSGEEVTQQHADLVARLKTARDTEERFRAILLERTGKIDEVLEVEQEIARVRGEIESMEAQQNALEHRVDFASVELQLTEEYKAALNPGTDSVSTRMHNALVRGYRNATGLILGMVLFFAEFGPMLLVLSVIFGVPVWLVWRRYRAAKASL
jgi:anti-sigma factor RsiW